jgi:hypothetical protein
MFPAITRAQFWAQSLGARQGGRPSTSRDCPNAVAMHQSRPGRARGPGAEPSGIELVATSFKLST